MSTALKKPMAFEQGDTLYIVSPVTPITPSASDIEAYAYGTSVVNDLRKKAPNEHIAWFGGHYVAAGQPNKNGAMWLSDELALKALTPMFMPVTVMHDPRSAVGVIADLRMNAEKTRIENVLACWKHRFPEVVAEAEENYAQGTLMQSMECKSPEYECSECGALFHKLPGGAERDLWCDHLTASQPSGGFGDFIPDPSKRQEGATAVRILRSVVFTGTGLIFGTQGGVGADPDANLESFQGAVAECHARAHRETYASRSSRSDTPVETVAKSEFDRVVAERDAAMKERDELKESVATVTKERDDAKASVEETEAKLKTTEKERDDAQAKVKTAEEAEAKAKLVGERFEALGEGFLAKLGDKTKENLKADAEAMSDEAWSKRLESVEELAGVKRDAKKDGEGGGDGGDGGETFSRDEAQASRLGGAATPAGGGANGQQTATTRRSVVAGLVKNVK